MIRNFDVNLQNILTIISKMYICRRQQKIDKFIVLILKEKEHLIISSIIIRFKKMHGFIAFLLNLCF